MYLCETCKNNNCGWCTVNRMNGLKKKNIQICDDYTKTNEMYQREPIGNGTYLCKNCSYNINGWCSAKKFNGLKKKNIQICDKFEDDRNANHYEYVKEYDEEYYNEECYYDKEDCDEDDYDN